MRFDMPAPRYLDVVPPASEWQAGEGCCDLCRTQAPLFRLLTSPDALCQGCFASWHG
jgi:hypothetical protein